MESRRKMTLTKALSICASVLTMFSCSGITEEPVEILPGSIYDGDIEILEPVASGEKVANANGVTIDYSNSSEGYIMIKVEPKEQKVKTIITHGDEKYTYNTFTGTDWNVYPLQLGNGSYEIKVYENITGDKYGLLSSLDTEVNQLSKNKVYLYPHQFIWYTNDKNAIKLSYDICTGIQTDKEKVEKIYNYITWYLSYDEEKAETVESGYIPDIDQILNLRKGICFDYSALFASMLRAQSIPVRLVMGYVQPDNQYHAWNQVYIDGNWVFMDPTFGPKAEQTEEDYTQSKFY